MGRALVGFPGLFWAASSVELRLVHEGVPVNPQGPNLLSFGPWFAKFTLCLYVSMYHEQLNCHQLFNQASQSGKMRKLPQVHVLGLCDLLCFGLGYVG